MEDAREIGKMVHERIQTLQGCVTFERSERSIEDECVVFDDEVITPPA